MCAFTCAPRPIVRSAGPSSSARSLVALAGERVVVRVRPRPSRRRSSGRAVLVVVVVGRGTTVARFEARGARLSGEA